MIILHKTNRFSAIRILNEGFHVLSSLTEDRVAKFSSNYSMISNNHVVNYDCTMFFSWDGPVINASIYMPISDMKPGILYQCENWRCCITETLEPNLRFLGAFLESGDSHGIRFLKNFVSDYKFYHSIADKIGQNIEVRPRVEDTNIEPAALP